MRCPPRRRLELRPRRSRFVCWPVIVERLKPIAWGKFGVPTSTSMGEDPGAVRIHRSREPAIPLSSNTGAQAIPPMTFRSDRAFTNCTCTSYLPIRQTTAPRRSSSGSTEIWFCRVLILIPTQWERMLPTSASFATYPQPAMEGCTSASPPRAARRKSTRSKFCRAHRTSSSRFGLSCSVRSFTDHNGQFWHPDDYYMNGHLSDQHHEVEGSPDPELFSTERYGHFSYAIPVDTRDRYTLILHFVELYFGNQAGGAGGVGSRVFKVMCNGETLLDNFDIYKEAGSLHVLTKTFYSSETLRAGQTQLDLRTHCEQRDRLGHRSSRRIAIKPPRRWVEFPQLV